MIKLAFSPSLLLFLFFVFLSSRFFSFCSFFFFPSPLLFFPDSLSFNLLLQRFFFSGSFLCFPISPPSTVFFFSLFLLHFFLSRLFFLSFWIPLPLSAPPTRLFMNSFLSFFFLCFFSTLDFLFSSFFFFFFFFFSETKLAAEIGLFELSFALFHRTRTLWLERTPSKSPRKPFNREPPSLFLLSRLFEEDLEESLQIAIT